MSYHINDSFSVDVALPIDDRSVCADLTARDAIASGVRYEGMSTYVVSVGKVYRLKGGVANTNWSIDGGVDPASNLLYIFGDATTDGSIRINTTNGDFAVEKRVAGSWTFMGSFSV